MTHACGSGSRAGLLGAILALASLGAAAQTNMSFLRDSPTSRFNAEDMRLMLEAGRAALESSEPGATQSWRNEKSRNSGRITVLQRFRFEQRDCQRVRVESRAKGMESQTMLSACRADGGAWKVDSHARPPAR